MLTRLLLLPAQLYAQWSSLLLLLQRHMLLILLLQGNVTDWQVCAQAVSQGSVSSREGCQIAIVLVQYETLRLGGMVKQGCQAAFLEVGVVGLGLGQEGGEAAPVDLVAYVVVAEVVGAVWAVTVGDGEVGVDREGFEPVVVFLVVLGGGALGRPGRTEIRSARSGC